MVSAKGTASLRKLDGCIPFGLEMDVKQYCTPDGAWCASSSSQVTC